MIYPRLQNYNVWAAFIILMVTKRSCFGLLTNEPTSDNLLEINDERKLSLLVIKFIHTNMYHMLKRETFLETYKYLKELASA